MMIQADQIDTTMTAWLEHINWNTYHHTKAKANTPTGQHLQHYIPNIITITITIIIITTGQNTEYINIRQDHHPSPGQQGNTGHNNITTTTSPSPHKVRQVASAPAGAAQRARVRAARARAGKKDNR